MAERDKSIDVLRGIGILLMVFGHLGTEYIEHYIYAFHMPLFFFISGLFAESISKKPLKRVIIDKAKTLLIPYIVFGLGNYAVWFAMNQNDPEAEQLLINLFWKNTEGLAVAGALWFLTALFFVDVMYWLITKWIHNEWIKLGICTMLALIGMCLPTFFSIRLPWALDNAMVGLLFFEVAHVMKKGCESKKNAWNLLDIKGWLVVLGMILHIALCFCNSKVVMFFGWYGNFALFFINAILGCILYYNLAHIVSYKMQEQKMGKWICLIMAQIGEKSIVFVCLNQMYIIFIRKVIHSLLLKLSFIMEVQYYVEIAGTFALAVIMLYLAAQIIYHKPLCFLIGKGFERQKRLKI